MENTKEKELRNIKTCKLFAARIIRFILNREYHINSIKELIKFSNNSSKLVLMVLQMYDNLTKRLYTLLNSEHYEVTNDLENKSYFNYLYLIEDYKILFNKYFNNLGYRLAINLENETIVISKNNENVEMIRSMRNKNLSKTLEKISKI